MDLKRTLGLFLLVAGVLLMLAGLNTIDAASRMSPVSNRTLHQTAWLILGGVAIAGVGIVLNPVGKDSASD